MPNAICCYCYSRYNSIVTHQLFLTPLTHHVGLGKMFELRRLRRIIYQIGRENFMKQQIPIASQPALLVETIPNVVEKTTLESRYLILIHNDEVTPYDYVIRTLERIFLLSEEMADHIATTAHNEGTAVVMVRPRNEAERLIKMAHSRARLDGYPLTFSMEQE